MDQEKGKNQENVWEKLLVGLFRKEKLGNGNDAPGLGKFKVGDRGKKRREEPQVLSKPGGQCVHWYANNYHSYPTAHLHLL